MKRTATRQSTRPPEAPPGTAAEFEDFRVLELPTGFWVQALTGGEKSGPYRSLVEAIEAQRDGEPEDAGGDDALAEVEAELGLSDWIDPDTSAPAEDGVPHIEDH